MRFQWLVQFFRKGVWEDEQWSEEGTQDTCTLMTRGEWEEKEPLQASTEGAVY